MIYNTYCVFYQFNHQLKTITEVKYPLVQKGHLFYKLLQVQFFEYLVQRVDFDSKIITD